MKLVKNFVFAVVFVSALAVNTFAGDQETPGFIPPPPPRYSQGVAPKEVPNDGTQIGENEEGAGTSEDYYLIYEAITALLSVF